MTNTETLPEHTRLSASGAERWMNCPGSQVMSENLGLTGEESSFAAEGTAAHELAEKCLISGQEAWEYLGETIYEHEVTDDMSLAVQQYLDYCRALTKMFPDALVWIEQRVDERELHPDFGGTADFILIGKDFIIVVDYKHGIGIAKDVKDNPQLMYYGFGALYKLGLATRSDIKNVHLAIVQPRAFHPDGTIREWTIDKDELHEWGAEELLPAMKNVDAPEPPLKAGEHCRFCPGKIGCPVMKSMFEAAKDCKIEDAQVPSDEELGLEFEQIDPVKMYLKALQTEAYNRALKGRKIPGGKMVRGQSNRVLNEGADKKAVKKFGDAAYTDRKLKSPAQLEKLVGGKKFVAANAHKKEGTFSFVPLSHKAREVKIESQGEKFKGIKKGKRND